MYACQKLSGKNSATLEKSKDRNISGVKSAGDKSSGAKKDKGKLPKNFKLENKYYPPRIYRLLSQDQKDQLKEWGEKKGKRSVASLKKQIKDELKSEMRKGDSTKDDSAEESSADDAAGKEFGRTAHKKKQKKE